MTTPEPAVEPAREKETAVETLRRIDKLWMKVESVLWLALQPFVEARVAVSDALEHMEAEESPA